jgi:hypothetical protein
MGLAVSLEPTAGFNDARERYAGGFSRLFWAFPFLAITIGPVVTLGSERFVIDLLPDFLGYALMAAGAHRLARLHGGARSIRNLALLLNFLALPLCIQYQVQTGQAGNVTYWLAPPVFWPFWVIVPLLDLVVVWKLCGLVADLGRWTNDWQTVQVALSRRSLYVLIRLLTLAGVAVALVMPASVGLIIGVVVVTVLLGIILLCLMMGLMSRARRICLTAVELPAVEAELGYQGRNRLGTWLVRLIRLAGVVLPILLAAGIIYYYQEWQGARNEALRRQSSSDIFQKVAGEFLIHLHAKRLDEAYALTTTEFQARVGREQFAELAKKYEEYQRHSSEGGSGSSGTFGSTALSNSHYKRAADGKVMRITYTIRRDKDSILYPQPPPMRVDDLKVETTREPALPLGFPAKGRK